MFSETTPSRMAELRWDLLTDSLCGILCKYDEVAAPKITGSGVGGVAVFSFTMSSDMGVITLSVSAVLSVVSFMASSSSSSI